MAGHSKWHSIRHKKGAADAKRGKIFTKHAQLIALAARDGGGDPEMNPALRIAIENAKADNTPNNNIDRAIKRGTGEDKNAGDILEATYEGYGPEGTALIISCVTDNKNRTVSKVKSTLTKGGGNLGTNGSVAYMFDRKGMLITDPQELKGDNAEMAIIESGADDFEEDEGKYTIYTKPEELAKVREAIQKEGFKVEKAELTYIPQNPVMLEEASKAKKVLSMMEKLEDLDDVVNVYSNFDVPESILSELE